jgi:hypothetical protein
VKEKSEHYKGETIFWRGKEQKSTENHKTGDRTWQNRQQRKVENGSFQVQLSCGERKKKT